jgi:hypothetical protein
MTNYGSRPMWHWILLYLLIGGFVYFLVYYFFLSKKDGSNMYRNDAENEYAAPETQAPVGQSATFTLAELNSSGQSGDVTMTEADGKVTVRISLTGTPADSVPQPAHIHAGACPGVGEVVHPLTTVVDGQSETVLETTFAELIAAMPLAINVHKSAEEAKVYVSCGAVELVEY